MHHLANWIFKFLSFLCILSSGFCKWFSKHREKSGNFWDAACEELQNIWSPAIVGYACGQVSREKWKNVRAEIKASALGVPNDRVHRHGFNILSFPFRFTLLLSPPAPIHASVSKDLRREIEFLYGLLAHLLTVSRAREIIALDRTV